jgi:cell division protein FtsW (lipid II flippase)
MLILLTISLILLGTLVRYLIYNSEGSARNFNVLSSFFAIIIFLAAYFFDFTTLSKYPKICYFIILLLSMVSLSVAPHLNGRAYLSFGGGLSIGLSNLALIFPLTYSLFIYAMRNRGTLGILLCGVAYLPYAILLLLVPSTSGFIIYTFSAMILLLTAIKREWFSEKTRHSMLMVRIPTVVSLFLTAILLLQQPYRLERIRIMLDPASDPRGYQTLMIRELMSGAIFAGSGYVPQQYDGMMSSSWFGSDMILTVLTNQYGWLAFIGIIILFFAFSALGLKYIAKQRSVLGLLVSLSILTIFVAQVVLYVAMNLGYGVLTVLSLPFISDGNATLLLNAGLIGILLSVFRTGEVIRDGYRAKVDNGSLISYEDGKLIINLKR